MAKVIDLNNRIGRVTCSLINSKLEDSSSFLYDNNVDVAKNLIKSLCSSEDRSNHVILAASMQSGKTAVMNAVCDILTLSRIDSDMGIKKFVYATGMNDVELKKQTLHRAYSQIVGANEDNVCFDLTKANKNSKFFFLKNSDLLNGKLSLKNTLLMMDEVQYGSNEKNNLTKFLVNNGIDWKDNDDLKKNNTYVISISATPFDEVISDVSKVKKIVSIKKDENYVGVSEFISADLIREAYGDEINNNSIFYYIRENYDRMMFETRGCGIIFIRTRDFLKIKLHEFVRTNFNIIELAANGSNIDYNSLYEPIEKMIARYDYLNEKGGKNRSKIKPILVLIKGAFRAGVTIPTRHKDFVYMIYDYSLNAETTAQALLGRMCGYRDASNGCWKRTYFYVNKKYADQYAEWEKDYTNRDNIPADKVSYAWVSPTYKGGKVEINSKCCMNREILLTDEEILSFHSKSQNRTSSNLCESVEPLFKEILKKYNLEEEIPYNYIGEAHISGKNNYARSSQIKRFESFAPYLEVFKIRPEKIKKFYTERGRKEFDMSDLGTKVVYLVLDAYIVYNKEEKRYIISGNKRLLVYYMEVALRTKVPNRRNMFKIHKCTDLNFGQEETKQ